MPDDSYDPPKENDATRLCPVCRMPISTLAIKCRHCGSTVGRPRKEAEQLTVQDLGGESKCTYTVSGNVMDALESFRAETESVSHQEEKQRKKKGWLKHKKNKEKEEELSSGPSDSGLPELDVYHQGLAGLAELDQEQDDKLEKARPTSVFPAYIERMIPAAKIIGIILVVGLVLYFGYPFARDLFFPKEVVVEVIYDSKGLEILEAGRPTIEALEECISAINHSDTPENQAIFDTVRKKFIEEVDAKVEAREWERQDLESASQLVVRAMKVTKHPDIVALQQKVKGEINAYALILKNVSADAQQATFRLGNQSEATVEVADYLQDRFLVTKISQREVWLEDSLQDNRRLKAATLTAVEACPTCIPVR